MSTAMALGNMGYEVDLVEKQDRLGGLLNDLNLVLPANEPPSVLLDDLTTRLESNPKVKIHTLSEVKKVEGYVGNYIVTLSENGTESKINAGVIVVAVGARVLKPEGLFNYDGEKVITHLELEAMLKKGGSQPKNVVMIQCVGSRCEERTYCSRICCMTAVKNAILLKEADPATNVTILYRDMQMYGVENEDMFRKSKEMGVRYVTYDPDRPPAVENGQVRVYHLRMGKEMAIPADLVVLSTPLDRSGGRWRHIHHAQSAGERERLFPGRSCEAETAGFRHRRCVPVRERPVPFDHKRGHFSGSWSGVQGCGGAFQGSALHQRHCRGYQRGHLLRLPGMRGRLPVRRHQLHGGQGRLSGEQGAVQRLRRMRSHLSIGERSTGRFFQRPDLCSDRTGPCGMI